MAMKKLNGKQWAEFTLLMILMVYFIVLACYTPQYSHKAALFPKVVLVFGSALLIAKILALFFPRVAAVLEPVKKEPELEIAAEEKVVEEEIPDKVSPRKVAGMIIWVLGTAGLCYCIGIIPTAFVSTLVFFLFYAKLRWYHAALLSVSLAAILYIVFNLLLKLRLYTGVFF